MKSCKKFGLAAIALVLGALLCMSLTGCPTPNSAESKPAESKPYVGIYTSESGVTLVLNGDGTSTVNQGGLASLSGTGTYTVSGSTATLTFTEGDINDTITAETTDNWATFTANSTAGMTNQRFTKQ